MSLALPPRPPQTETLAPGVRRVLAQNPSAMTFWGTNTYLVGTGEVAVIDPGPASGDHLTAIETALAPGERISHIFVTHAHLDHSPGAALLAARTGAPVLAFGDASAGRSPRMQALAETGDISGGEGVDAGFVPDGVLQDGDSVDHGDWSLRALWTPGHFSNHLCFAWDREGYLFSGDLVMGWASSLVSPPDGDLGAFMRSLDRLAARRSDRVYFPGHGGAVDAPQRRVAELSAHRRMRHDQILAALQEKPGTAAELAERIYTDTPAALIPAAARNVLAHLLDMEEKSQATVKDGLHSDAVFSAK